MLVRQIKINLFTPSRQQNCRKFHGFAQESGLIRPIGQLGRQPLGRNREAYINV